MELNDDLLIRRKRVDENGYWQDVCRSCGFWLYKNKFRGCIDYIDAYGNCLMCSSCRASKAQTTLKNNMRQEANNLYRAMGYDPSSEIPIHIQFLTKHNLPINKKDL